MVQLTSTFLFLLASLATPSLSAVIDDVVSQITNIASQVNTVNKQVNAIPPGGQISILNAALLMSNGNSLSATLNVVTGLLEGLDAATVAPDAQELFNQVSGIQPTSINSLNVIVAKKAAFSGVPSASTFILQTLQSLNASNTGLENALLNVAPSALLTPGVNIKNGLDSAFAAAIAAYSV